jgi:hypothetical protein
MAKKDGYIFWCSKCKVDHAGECDTVAKTKGVSKYIYFFHAVPPLWNGQEWVTVKPNGK